MDFITMLSAVNIEVKYRHPNGYYDFANYTLLDCLTRRKNPREIVLESYPRNEIISVQVQFRQAASIRPECPQTANEAKLNEFWKLCSELEQKRCAQDRDPEAEPAAHGIETCPRGTGKADRRAVENMKNS
jgi:hypothetical protein